MVLDAALVSNQYHKVQIKDKVEQHPPLHLGGIAIEEGAFGSLSTTVANFLGANEKENLFRNNYIK